MNAWTSYRLQDFVPFTEEVYFRLLERMGESFWPLHMFTLALGAAAIGLAFKGHTRLACLLSAPLWIFVGVAFFAQRYADLNWAGGYVGYAFIAQGVLLAAAALCGLGLNGAPPQTSPSVLIGLGITLFGLAAMPLIAPLTGHSWYQAQVFGIHADPTAVTTLGLLVMAFRGWVLWAANVIPMLWILISGLTLQVLDSSLAPVWFAVLGVGLAALVWSSCQSRRERSATSKVT